MLRQHGRSSWLDTHRARRSARRAVRTSPPTRGKRAVRLGLRPQVLAEDFAVGDIMSGGRLITMLTHELRRTGGRYGLAAMCIGVGQGIATVVERLDA